jgi:hypothetical protein
MGLSYYDERRKPKTGLAKGWMVLNAGIAIGMVFYWTGIAGVVSEPFKWAMRDGVTIHPGLFDYPYFLLWATPAMCMLAGWLAVRANQHSVARIVGGYPTMVLVLMLGWYYLAPMHWL